MPFRYNPGATLGLLSVILFFIILMKLRKRKAERGWIRYGEDQIYRPDEWEAEQRRIDKSRGCPETIRSESGIDSNGSREEESRFNGEQEGISVEQDSINESDSLRDQTSKDTEQESSIAIPDLEQTDEGDIREE